MLRLGPLLVLVSLLLAGWARTPWAAVAGPLLAAALWSLDRRARQPAAPAPARRREQPTP
jgi:hypothetical protein